MGIIGSMKKIINALMGLLMMAGLVNVVVSMRVSAVGFEEVSGAKMFSAGTFDDTFLGMRAWYYGLDKDDKGGLLGPTDKDGIPKFVFKIVMNVLYDLEVIIGLLATGFIIYGGYQIMVATGDAGKMAKGKKTVTRAVIGVVIAVLAQAITAFITDNLTF